MIKLGYEITTGKEVSIKPSHLIVTGITQLSGKTTTLEVFAFDIGGVIENSGMMYKSDCKNSYNIIDESIIKDGFTIYLYYNNSISNSYKGVFK